MIKAAVIGLGKMGISHAAILGGLPDVELAAVCDTDGLIQSGFGKLTRIPFFTDYRKMIDTVRPDCVYVITPTRMHYEMVKYALQNGCHVFCEKPFAVGSIRRMERVFFKGKYVCTVFSHPECEGMPEKNENE